MKIASIVKDAQDKLNAIERPEREDDFHQRYSHEEMRGAGNRSTAISMADNVRVAAAHALAESKHPEAIPLLLSMRKDNYWPVRLTVVQALSQLGTPEAITILQEMSKDGNEYVSREANKYLSSKEKI